MRASRHRPFVMVAAICHRPGGHDARRETAVIAPLRWVSESYSWRHFRSSRIWPIIGVGGIALMVAYGLYPHGIMNVVISAYVACTLIVTTYWNRKHPIPRKKRQKR